MTQNLERRYFIGLSVDSAAGSKLLQLPCQHCDHLRDERLYSLERLHLTVCFLGNLDDDTVPSIVDLVKSTAEHTGYFSVNAKQLTKFGRKKNTLVALCSLSQSLSSLYRELNQGLLVLGMPRENRPFRPHVTLSRYATETEIVQPRFDLSFEAKSLILYESVPAEDGSKYIPVAEVDFSPPPME